MAVTVVPCGVKHPTCPACAPVHGSVAREALFGSQVTSSFGTFQGRSLETGPPLKHGAHENIHLRNGVRGASLSRWCPTADTGCMRDCCRPRLDVWALELGAALVSHGTAGARTAVQDEGRAVPRHVKFVSTPFQVVFELLHDGHRRRSADRKRGLRIGNPSNRVAAATGQVWIRRRHDREEVVLAAACSSRRVQTRLQVLAPLKRSQPTPS